MAFQFNVPIVGDDPLAILVEPGASVIFVGANGSGKTRLAVHIEDALGLRGHRISAHRALSLNPAVPKISEKSALFGLRTGRPAEDAKVQHRGGHRWHNKAATILLNDFDFLVQALFADQANISLETYKCGSPAADGSCAPAPQDLRRKTARQTACRNRASQSLAQIRRALNRASAQRRYRVFQQPARAFFRALDNQKRVCSFH